MRLFGAFACYAVAPSAAWSAGEALPVAEIADGIFVHAGALAEMDRTNRGDIANIGFVIGDEAVAVIDTGGSPAVGEALLAAIRARTARPIRYVINTHVHPDHIFGNAAFRETGSTLVGHHAMPASLAERGPHYIAADRPAMGADLLAAVDLTAPVRLVDDRMTLDLGGRSLELSAWPSAHSDTDLTVFDQRTKTLFAGDLVFLERVPSLDGSLLGWLKVLAMITGSPAERVVPGHGPVTAPWPAAAGAELAYFKRLAGDLRAAIAAGTPMAEAVQAAGLAERPNWALFDNYNARNATTAFAELEWE